MKNALFKKCIALFVVLAILLSSTMLIIFSSRNIYSMNLSNYIADTSNDAISNRSIEIGTGGDGSMANPYTDSTWNGRVKLTREYLQSGGGVTYFIDLNIDPRNNIFDDNILIEYNHYTLTNYMGTKENCKILLFSAKVQFYDGNGYYINTLVASKGNDAQAAFTRYSGSKIVNGVRVQVYIEGGYSGQVKKYFFFKFGTAPAFTNYI